MEEVDPAVFQRDVANALKRDSDVVSGRTEAMQVVAVFLLQLYRPLRSS